MSGIQHSTKDYRGDYMTDDIILQTFAIAIVSITVPIAVIAILKTLNFKD